LRSIHPLEDVMPSIRIAAAGAMLAVTVSGAAAQTAPGKPLPLLQIVEAPAKVTPNHHLQRPHKAATRIAKKPKFAWRARTRSRHTLARVDQRPAPAQPVPETPAANIQPAPSTVPADAVSTYVQPQPDASPVAGIVGTESLPASIAPPSDAALSAIVVDGQTVQVASPDELNDIDRDADKPMAAEDATLQSNSTPAPAAPTASAAPAAPAAPVTMTAAAPHAATPVGSASWIAKLLAALGGAVAAGSAAWFMIGSAPPRIYLS
jgi:hypothetical protein